MDKSNIIVWEKWRDPLGYDDLEEKLLHYNYTKKLDEDEDDESNDHDKEKISFKNIREQFAITPLGLMPLTDNTVSSKIFNFWTGHTIFTISRNISNIIENIEGVETLDIFTRYRFRISVGKAFQDSVVLRNINDAIFKHLKIDNTNE